MASAGFDSLHDLLLDIVGLERPRDGEPMQALQIELKSAWARCPKVGTLVGVLQYAASDDCVRLSLTCLRAAAGGVPLAAADRRLSELTRLIDDWTRGRHAREELQSAVEEAIRYLGTEGEGGYPDTMADLVLAAASFLGEATLSGATLEIHDCISTLEDLERRLPGARFGFADIVRRDGACPSATILVNVARKEAAARAAPR